MSLSQPGTSGARRRRTIVTAIGITQIIVWVSSYYLPAVIALAVAVDTAWSLAWVVSGLSLGLLVGGLLPRA